MAKGKRKFVVKNRKYTIRRIFLLVLAALLVAGMVIAAVFIMRGCSMSLTSRELPFDSSCLYGYAGDGILYVKNSQLCFMSFSNEDANFSRALDGVPTNLCGTSGIKVIYSDGAMQILDAPFNNEMNGQIVQVRCGDSHAAVCKRNADGRYELRLYDAAGQQVYQQDYAEGELCDFGFSDADGNILWTCRTSVESGTPVSTISTYDMNRMSTTGVISVQGQLVERVFFTDSGVFIIGTESVIRCNSDNKEQYRVQIYGYRVDDIARVGTQVVLMLVPRDGSAGEYASVRLLTLKEKSVADESASTVRLPDRTVGCCLSLGRLLAFTSDTIYIYNTDGSVDEMRSAAAGITSVTKLDEAHIMIERSGGLALVTFKR